jgi:hypothetical protein
MNVDKGLLYKDLAAALEAGEKKMDIKEVPKHLQAAAEKELAGKKSAKVDMDKSSPISDWAKSQQAVHPKKNKRRVRRKIATESRKRNRK